MKQFLKFLTKINSFWKLYQNYGYDGEEVEFIIDNYEKILDSRTKTMSKPTYYAKDVIGQIDEWYEGKYAPDVNVEILMDKDRIPKTYSKERNGFYLCGY